MSLRHGLVCLVARVADEDVPVIERIRDRVVGFLRAWVLVAGLAVELMLEAEPMVDFLGVSLARRPGGHLDQFLSLPVARPQCLGLIVIGGTAVLASFRVVLVEVHLLV